MVCDTVYYVNTAIKENRRIIVEGANAAMLDIDFGTDSPSLSVANHCLSSLFGQKPWTGSSFQQNFEETKGYSPGLFFFGV